MGPINRLVSKVFQMYTLSISMGNETEIKMGKQQLNSIVLSQEQEAFIKAALDGKNILVDACIGSGKTTAIQYLCDLVSSDTRVLYLTYNRLLKMDARKRIKNKNVTVTNYHGFAYSRLKSANLTAGVQDMIQEFLKNDISVPQYDILLIDEYQDIEQEFADELLTIKKWNPKIQIIAVGDMEQKIYDKTTLDVQPFIQEYLGDYLSLSFTKCFRLSEELAMRLGRIWDKSIVGVNKNCLVEEMSVDDVCAFLSTQQPRDVLCLGSRTGIMSKVLNWMEDEYPSVWNKKTVYASIQDGGKLGTTEPNSKTAIFTTFDSSKGMERKVCIVFDYTESYWSYRLNQPQQKYEILRNVFCVAASRGKEHIIFVNNKEAMLSEDTLKTSVVSDKEFGMLDITDLFDFKYVEDVEACYKLLNINEIEEKDHSTITVKNRDEMIDLSPCIGIYQEAMFFDGYDIDEAIYHFYKIHDPSKMPKKPMLDKLSVEEKVLWLTSLETKQKRYRNQVELPLVDSWSEWQIKHRLATEFETDEDVQKACALTFSDSKNGPIKVFAIGMLDVLKNETVYELKFVSELQHSHFLQCACYMVALGLEKGILWNTRDNKKFEIAVPDKQKFLDAVIKTVTKGAITKYYKPGDGVFAPPIEKTPIRKNPEKDDLIEEPGIIAVLDTETNFGDEVMSIGAVIADGKTFDLLDEHYVILKDESKRGGMFSSALYDTTKEPIVCNRKKAISGLKKWLDDNHVQKVFAYNAFFDYNHLPEMSNYEWFDIMKLAANVHYNQFIPADADVYKSGKLKRGYGVEAICRMVTENEGYCEKHNALEDARDELTIMKKLDLPLVYYSKEACIGHGQNRQSSKDKRRKAKVEKTSLEQVAFSVGMHVKYPHLGIGTIVEVTDGPFAQILRVEFSSGVKTVMGNDLGLELASDSSTEVPSNAKKRPTIPKTKATTPKTDTFADRKAKYEAKVYERSNHSIEVLEYTGSKEKVTVKCRLCNYEWNPRADHLLAKCVCPRCKKESNTSLNEKWFIDKIYHLSHGDILVTGYNNIDDYVTAECRTCGNTWWPKAYELYQNCKCPYCKVKKQPIKVKVKVKRKKG